MANIDFNKFLSNAFSVGLCEKGIFGDGLQINTPIFLSFLEVDETSGKASLSISSADGKDHYLEGTINADNWAKYCEYMA